MARMIEEIGVEFTAWTNYFPLLLRVQTNYGGYTPSYILFISPRLKRLGHKTENLQPSRGRMCGGASAHPKVYMAWCIMQPGASLLSP